MGPVKAANIVIVLLVVIIGIGAIAFWSERLMTFNRPAARRTTLESMRPAFEGPKKIVVLFFLARGQNILQEETREIVGAATTTEDAKRTLTELAKGPESDLVPTIPRAAQVRNFFIDSSGTAYADFDRELKEGHGGGAQEELYTVFSIVNTLASNFAQIKRVQILMEGVEIPTLAGNVDTRMPLSPQYLF